jgi:hypothetical protein
MGPTRLFRAVFPLLTLFLSQHVAFRDGSLQAGSYATADSPSAQQRSFWDCFTGSSAGPVEYEVGISYTCSDPQAHPENMPGGTAFTYPSGSSGVLLSVVSGQCSIRIP